MNVADAVIRCEVLPHPAYNGLWDAIVVPDKVKDHLLRSALLALTLRAQVPFEESALHGLFVLHGPPGTGKTTLARGLAAQIATLANGHAARLIEINPHGLMSAEHGQSQQKVAELLGVHVPQLAEDGLPTVVLLDEVESMAIARSEASLAANPADVHRATDAVLTALDNNASMYPHILTVATSNFTSALDAAFISRADVAIEVPPPDAEGALAILQRTLMAMSDAFPPLARLAGAKDLRLAAERLAGCDGRRIRKTVTEAMLQRLDSTLDPGLLELNDLLDAAAEVAASRQTDKQGRKAPHAAA